MVAVKEDVRLDVGREEDEEGTGKMETGDDP